MAKGTLTIREKELAQLSREEWAARFKATPVAELLCSGTWCSTGPHVHPKHRTPGLLLTFRVDPATGRWLNPDREAS
jgi:hypothetical protein